uniref:Transcriptional regulator NikR, CopG family n=1 Tax=uncultured organism TaxID=155900 RepID=M1P0Z9_9ZZZZ|nr:transcriptional regulator NikR, CopG family [uncultured organism]
MSVISVSIPSDLLEKLKKVEEEEGYSNRSELMRESVRDYLNEYRKRRNREGEAIGFLSIMYGLEDKNCSEKIDEIHHQNDELVEGSLHLHFDDKNCFDIWMVKGRVKEITELIEKLKTTMGTKHIGNDLVNI